MINKTLVIHGGARGDYDTEVTPYDVRFIFFPPEEEEEEPRAIACFSFGWHDGSRRRSGFMIPVPSHPGENHFDLVFSDGSVELAKPGLHPWKDGEPDPEGLIFWHEPIEEPRNWHDKIIVVQGQNVTYIYAVGSGGEGAALVEWWRGSEYVKVRGNGFCFTPIGIEGREMLEAVVEALHLILVRMEQKESNG
jgi:hypothetical protein